MAEGWSLGEMAQLVADDLPAGAYVNLGIGLPNLVASATGRGGEIYYHSENGVIGVGPRGSEDEAPVPDLIDAGKNPVTLIEGASFFGHDESFAMIRGGRIDIAVMGAYQVSQDGDLANWWTGETGVVPAVGGAMDLAYGARQVWAMCRHATREGDSKLVAECTYPLTGTRCVTRIYTNLAVLRVADGTMTAERIAPGVTWDELVWATACPVLSGSGAELEVSPAPVRVD